ncbi:IS3 family transposase [Rothia nasisuis]
MTGWCNNDRLQERFKGLTPMQNRSQALEVLTV